MVNSASYPSRDGKWVVAYEVRGEGLLWLIGAVVNKQVRLFLDGTVKTVRTASWPHYTKCLAPCEA